MGLCILIPKLYRNNNTNNMTEGHVPLFQNESVQNYSYEKKFDLHKNGVMLQLS